MVGRALTDQRRLERPDGEKARLSEPFDPDADPLVKLRHDDDKERIITSIATATQRDVLFKGGIDAATLGAMAPKMTLTIPKMTLTMKSGSITTKRITNMGHAWCGWELVDFSIQRHVPTLWLGSYSWTPLGHRHLLYRISA